MRMVNALSEPDRPLNGKPAAAPLGQVAGTAERCRRCEARRL